MIKMVKKYSAEELFRCDGYNKIEILRLVPKSAGVYAYMPHAVTEALHLSRDDRSLVCFIDDSSSYTTLIIFKDTDLSDLLKSEILSHRERAQQLQQELKMQLQVQRQQDAEAELDSIAQLSNFEVKKLEIH